MWSSFQENRKGRVLGLYVKRPGLENGVKAIVLYRKSLQHQLARNLIKTYPRNFPAETTSLHSIGTPPKSNRGSRIMFTKLYLIGDPRANRDSKIALFGFKVYGPQIVLEPSEGTCNSERPFKSALYGLLQGKVYNHPKP